MRLELGFPFFKNLEQGVRTLSRQVRHPPQSLVSGSEMLPKIAVISGVCGAYPAPETAKSLVIILFFRPQSQFSWSGGSVWQFPCSWSIYRELCLVGAQAPSFQLENLRQRNGLRVNSLRRRTGNFLRRTGNDAARNRKKLEQASLLSPKGEEAYLR